MEKRSRGRPIGDGKDDTKYLVQVADILVREPGLRPTTAMNRVMRGLQRRESDETLRRRWQVKWKGRHESFMAAAHERARVRASEQAAAKVMTGLQYVQDFKRLSQLDSCTLGRLFGGEQVPPIMKITTDFPPAKLIGDLENSPVTKAIRALIDSPAMKAMDEVLKSPAVKAMIDYASSPAGKRMVENSRLFQKQMDPRWLSGAFPKLRE